jgi:hypothetical protein
MALPANHLIRNAIAVGIDAVSLRAVLRETRTDLIADGPGANLGVHDFGVLYVHRNAQRFVVRDGKVFDVPQRDVLKLRPEKSVPDELTESDDVRIEQDFDFGSGNVAWHFKSTSRANRFEVVLPTAHAGNDYDFVRDDELGVQTYVLAKFDMPDYNLQNIAGIAHNPTTKEVFGIRYTRDLRSMTAQPSGVAHVAIANLVVEADVSTVGLKRITDTTYGAEALAWLRQRAIDIADR